MKVVSLGTDEGVFEAGSAVYMRQEAYARTLGRVDLVVLSKRPHDDRQNDPLSIFAAHGGSAISRLLSARRVARALSKPDVVTVQDPFEVGLVGWMVAKHFGVPLHVQVHTDLFDPAYARHSLVNRIRLCIARFVLERAARIRVVSEKAKIAIERICGPSAPVTVLPIFADIAQLRNVQAAPELLARFQRFKTRVLVVGRLEQEKRVGLAIRSFADAAPEDACLVIVGEGSERANLEALSRVLQISDRVFFEGRRLSAPYYRLADLVLVPSAYEGYGLVIVEALATGKPVLATDVGIARDAGAIVSSERDFAADLKKWFATGPREAKLEHYPYRDFGEYVRAYCEDIEACKKSYNAYNMSSV